MQLVGTAPVLASVPLNIAGPRLHRLAAQRVEFERPDLYTWASRYVAVATGLLFVGAALGWH
jgi:hypothetical protein